MATKTTSAGRPRTTAAAGTKRAAGKTAAATAAAVRTTAAAGARRVVGKTANTATAAATRVAKKARSAADTATKLSGSASKAGLSALGTASDLGGLVAEASRNTLAINPLIGLNKRDVASAAGSLLKAVASTPRRASTHLGRYVKELGQVVKGKSELVPDPKDRRFADPAWKSNALYARLMQSYLATQKELSLFIDQSALNKLEKGRAHFFASLITDALAPSNWVLGNPAAVRKIVDTGGDNLVKGLKNLIHDARHNHMLPSMVDATPFKVGETIATSPGQVVLRHEMFELLQFAPTTPQVHARPLVMSPPQVNKYYAIDLTPDKSLVKWAADSGVQLFVVSWRNPTLEHRHWGLDDYVQALDAAVDAACGITGSPDVNMWGSCSGGMTLAAYLAWLAATGKPKVVNTTWAVCVLEHRGGDRGLDAGPVQLAGDDPCRQGALPAQGLRRWRGDGIDVRLATPERPDLELLGQQLPARQQAPRPTTYWPGTPTPPGCPASITVICSSWSRRTRTSMRARSKCLACRST
jgi:hypothetical protein